MDGIRWRRAGDQAGSSSARGMPHCRCGACRTADAAFVCSMERVQVLSMQSNATPHACACNEALRCGMPLGNALHRQNRKLPMHQSGEAAAAALPVCHPRSRPTHLEALVRNGQFINQLHGMQTARGPVIKGSFRRAPWLMRMRQRSHRTLSRTSARNRSMDWSNRTFPACW